MAFSRYLHLVCDPKYEGKKLFGKALSTLFHIMTEQHYIIKAITW